jgi:hypothetical protein
MLSIVIGGIIGFTIFLFELESPSMGGIIFRMNSDGVKVFSPDSLFEIMKAPFKFIHFWTTLDLLRCNWIFLIMIGIMSGIIVKNLIFCN